MALARALIAVRTSVLNHLRIPASVTATQHQAGPASLQCVRGFAGTYLDKNEVTERILSVVKNFEKVDQSKACSPTCADTDVWLPGSDRSVFPGTEFDSSKTNRFMCRSDLHPSVCRSHPVPISRKTLGWTV